MRSNIHTPEGVHDAGRVANRTARNAASSRWMTVLARLGYAAKGIVYLIIGWLAVQLAIGAGGKTTDQRGALQTIYEQSYGKFLLAIVVIGLLGFAIWCFLQAWFDTEGKGRDIKGIIGRLGYAVTGVTYAVLAFGAFQLVAGKGPSSATKSTTSSTQDVTAQLLKHSWGVAVVVILGLIVIGVACYMFAKAYTAKFQRRLLLTGLSAQLRRGVIFLGRFGYAALDLAQRFVTMVRSRQQDQLDPWLEACLSSGIPDLRTFAEGLQREYDAIKAAITYPYSTGPVEGQINRLKFIKRSMYGRGSFELLRQRVLIAA